MCSIERDPLRQDHTTCTAVAPEAVLTVRMYATSAAYDHTLVFKFRPIRKQTRSSAIAGRCPPLIPQNDHEGYGDDGSEVIIIMVTQVPKRGEKSSHHR
jgi:hypothetical protein